MKQLALALAAALGFAFVMPMPAAHADKKIIIKRAHDRGFHEGWHHHHGGGKTVIIKRGHRHDY